MNNNVKELWNQFCREPVDIIGIESVQVVPMNKVT